MSKLEEGTKVTILMDVDGVLNDWSAHPTRALDTGLEYTEFEATPYERETYDTFAGFRIFYSKDILKRVIELHNRDNVEVKWLTTWCEGANRALRREFGFGEDLEVIGSKHHDTIYNGREWWKLAAVQDYMAEHPDEFIIWVDDDIKHEHKAQQYIYEFSDSIVTVSPDPCLSHEDLDRIEEWIN